MDKMENQKPICKVNGDGTKQWYLNGKLHREDGPAIEYVDGDKYWFLKNKFYGLEPYPPKKYLLGVLKLNNK